MEIDDVFGVHGDAYLDDIQDLGSSNGNRTPSVESLSDVVDDISLCSRSSSDSLDGDDIGLPSMDVDWTVPGSPRIDFDLTVGLPDEFQNLGVHDRPPDFDIRFRNQIALADFLKQQLPYLLSPLNIEASDIPAFDLLDEFARGRHTFSSLSRSLKRQAFHVNVAKNELLLRFRHYTDSKGVDISDRESIVESAHDLSDFDQLRDRLLSLGLALPYLKFYVGVRQPFFYFPRMLHIQRLFRSVFFCRLLLAERDRLLAVFRNRPEMIDDWTDGTWCGSVFKPFAEAVIAAGEYPLALSSYVDGANVLSWGQCSVTPMLQVVLNLPQAPFQELDAYELRLMYELSFPVFNAVTRTRVFVRAMLACIVMDYKELSSSSLCSMSGKRDACIQCNTEGVYISGVRFPGNWRYASSDSVRDRMRTAYNRRRDVQLRRPSRRFEPAPVD
ncbi:unnamed protein product (mitochondrion) [Plasmodiophora brassicae]|uniref:Uncharacterized protein n=1 Tax=Plasmodiophora brassicae TaxID=37360 RepID=A0A3P3YKP6_PLABS|nr:unnamed protein product [Plasmodiophora brassicae]